MNLKSTELASVGEASLYQVLVDRRYTRGNDSTRGWGGRITTPGLHLGTRIYLEPLELTARLNGIYIGHGCWNHNPDFMGRTLYCALGKKHGSEQDPYFLASEIRAVRIAFAGIKHNNILEMDFFGYDPAFAHYVLRDGPPLQGLLPLEGSRSFPREGGRFRVTRRYAGQGGVEPTLWIQPAPETPA